MQCKDWSAMYRYLSDGGERRREDDGGWESINKNTVRGMGLKESARPSLGGDWRVAAGSVMGGVGSDFSEVPGGYWGGWRASSLLLLAHSITAGLVASSPCCFTGRAIGEGLGLEGHFGVHLPPKHLPRSASSAPSPKQPATSYSNLASCCFTIKRWYLCPA